MSADDRNNQNEKARVQKGQSDGEYLLALGAAGPTNKFQAKWYQEEPPKGQPHRQHWLIDKGKSAEGQLMAGYSLCDINFQSRAQTVKSHESSSSHQKKGTAWMLKQKDRAGW
eukprot:1155081-Pelagomonas_calceolata.AAC.6